MSIQVRRRRDLEEVGPNSEKRYELKIKWLSMILGEKDAEGVLEGLQCVLEGKAPAGHRGGEAGAEEMELDDEAAALDARDERHGAC